MDSSLSSVPQVCRTAAGIIARTRRRPRRAARARARMYPTPPVGACPQGAGAEREVEDLSVRSIDREETVSSGNHAEKTAIAALRPGIGNAPGGVTVDEEGDLAGASAPPYLFLDDVDGAHRDATSSQALDVRPRSRFCFRIGGGSGEPAHRHALHTWLIRFGVVLLCCGGPGPARSVVVGVVAGAQVSVDLAVVMVTRRGSAGAAPRAYSSRTSPSLKARAAMEAPSGKSLETRSIHSTSIDRREAKGRGGGTTPQAD